MTATSTATAPAASPLPPFEHSYAALPDHFYAEIQPTPVPEPLLLRLNHALANELGLDADWLASAEGVSMLAGNRLPDTARPIAMAYAGHQFGHFVPSLGDGRAILLGEVIDIDGRRRDVQLKGAGRTPFSRSGDGRAVLGPVLREYILGEAMHGLGIPTTRALAMVATGEMVFRDYAEPGAILARVAASHIRVGTFEYFARRGNHDAVRTLADYLIRRHYPELANAEDPYAELLAAVAARQGRLIARWLLVGFIHGVMNTDNMALSGETIDYGPCAFMDEYDPNQVYSSIDRYGRYAYGQQPSIGLWNLTQLANCLLPLLARNPDDDIEAAKTRARTALDAYGKAFEPAYYGGLRAKIGLLDEPGADRTTDDELVTDLLGRMAQHRADFTNTFRLLSDASPDDPSTLEAVRGQFIDPAAFDEWAVRWRTRLGLQNEPHAARQARMRTVNPAYIPRNHRVQEVIDAATEHGDLEPLERLLAVLSQPHDDHAALAEYRRPPEEHEVVRQTFCGT